MKRLVVSCWLLVVGVVLASGAFGESVDYWYLTKQTVEATCITTGGGLLGGGWYYAEGDVELELPLLCIGTTETPARIILKDGARLVLRGVDNYPGLYVGANSKLEIYGQRLGTGKLIAYGSANAPGIGGGGASYFSVPVQLFGETDMPDAENGIVWIVVNVPSETAGSVCLWKAVVIGD